jgi:putative restriction endonuclease
LIMAGAVSQKKPNFGAAGDNWEDEGWHVAVEYKELSNPIRPKDHISLLSPHLQKKYAPISEDGNGKQAVYLAEVTEPMANALMSLMDAEANLIFNTFINRPFEDIEEDEHEAGIQGRTDISATIKQSLVNSRRGQGLFKSNVCLNERACRVTGVTDIKHLRASHIKPWSVSTDDEKLSGCNGLLLSPHIDHLFDQGFITFKDDGQLMVSARLDPAILIKWSIDPLKNVGKFKDEQLVFLAYHRQHIFK